MFNSLQFENFLKENATSLKKLMMSNSVGHFIPLISYLRNDDLPKLSDELGSLFGCNLCQSFVHFIRSPPVDDYIVNVFNLSVLRACMSEYDIKTC